MAIVFTKTIRDQVVTVYADDFDCDPDTGLECGPNEIWAETEDEQPFELSEQEAEQLSQEATECYLNNDWDLNDYVK